MPSVSDITFIGSGISCTAVLLEILNKIKKDNLVDGNPVDITIIESSAEFWKGIPYSARSSVNSLTITNFGEFVPVAEKNQFVAWLENNRELWMNDLRVKGGVTATKWLDSNRRAINEGQWDEIYIPRYLFGEYLQEKIHIEIEKAQINEKVRVRYLQGLATDVRKNGSLNYEIKVSDKSPLGIWVQTVKVVLCIGSPPVKPIELLSNGSSYTYINDTYFPSLTDNIKTIRSVLSAVPKEEDRNILLLGSNASSLELLYLINTTPELNTRLNKVLVLSHSGNLPNRINTYQDSNYEFDNMNLLKIQDSFSSEDLMIAVEKDVSIASSKAINVADIYYRLSDFIVELLEKLDYSEKKKFHCLYGADFSKLIRRAGAEYRDAASELERSGKLEILKGSLLYVKPANDSANAAVAVYQPYDNNGEKSLPLHFPLIINCGGFETLDTDSSSELISNLLLRNFCERNCTGRGFKVNDKFEASEGLYIMGPLLGGIFNDKTKLWHVENAKSIFYLANLLVNELPLGDIKKKLARSNKLLEKDDQVLRSAKN